MVNKTTIKIPHKYVHMLDEVYQDSDGYWAVSKCGFYFNHNDEHVACEDTQRQLLGVIRTLRQCECEECKKQGGC